mmetsp:Transcript_13741/g.26955  ORF Transcript_13741/g.26955 Transcript_13741/m.26955 type:complete len:478 (+) Transcript_13741:193-1626(+)
MQDAPAAPSQPAPMLASRYSSASQGGYLLRDALRIRHVREIIMRNIEGENVKWPLDSYYTLALDTKEGESKQEPFLTSNICTRTLNPDWAPLDTISGSGKPSSKMPSSVVYDSKPLRLTVYVRAHEGHEWEVLLEKKFRLQDLEYLQSSNSGKSLGVCGPNAIIFKLRDGVYTFGEEVKIPVIAPPRTGKGLKITASAILKQLTRLSEEVDAYHRALKSRKELESELNNALMKAEARMAQVRRTRASLSMLAEIRKDVEHEKTVLAERLKDIRSQRQALKPRGELMLVLWKELEAKKKMLEQNQKKSGASHRTRLVAGTRVFLRQMRMLSFLYSIYPVRKVTDRKSSHGATYYIRNVTIADRISESFAQEMSVALGYCAHMVVLASKYLGVVLRYRIVYQASKSMVVDDVQEPVKKVALYYKESHSRGMIHGGIGMMIVNVGQLLDACNLRPSEASGGSGTHLLHRLYVLQRQIMPE